MAARAFLEALNETAPYRIHTIRNPSPRLQASACRARDDGIRFAPLPKNRNGVAARYFGHPFGSLCRDQEIAHRLTKPMHPWISPPSR